MSDVPFSPSPSSHDGRRERHALRMVALFAAPLFFALACLYAHAVVVGVGTRFDFAIMTSAALIVAVTLALFTLVIALRVVFFVRMPFRLMWAALLVVALFVGTLVMLSPTLGIAGDPTTIALGPLRALVDDVSGALPTSAVPSVDPTTTLDREPDDKPPASAEADDTPPKPVSPSGREAGDYEWAWTDADGNFHVTTKPPPGGAKVLSKVRRK